MTSKSIKVWMFVLLLWAIGSIFAAVYTARQNWWGVSVFFALFALIYVVSAVYNYKRLKAANTINPPRHHGGGHES